MWKRRIAYYLIGVLFGVLLVNQLPIAHRKTSVSQFPPTADHVALANAEWGNVSRSPTADDLSGRIILLFFVDDACASCFVFEKELQRWQQYFVGDLFFLPVLAQRAAIEKLPTFLQTQALVVDEAQKLQKNFSIPQFPSFILLRPDGQRMKMYSGEAVQTQEIFDDLLYVRQLFLHKIKNFPLK